MADDLTVLAGRAERAQDPAEGLRALHLLREQLAELEARHVDRALARGWSWAQVGRALDISKQAAHRRHAGREPAAPMVAASSEPPPARTEPRVVITGDARTVVASARKEAARLGESEVQPGHLLVALLQAPAGVAREALLDLGVDTDTARGELARESSSNGAGPASAPGMSTAMRAVLEDSLGESQRLCHGHLGPEHLLLALLRDQDGPAAALLSRLGASSSDLEAAVCDVLKRTDFARSL